MAPATDRGPVTTERTFEIRQLGAHLMAASAWPSPANTAEAPARADANRAGLGLAGRVHDLLDRNLPLPGAGQFYKRLFGLLNAPTRTLIQITAAKE